VDNFGRKTIAKLVAAGYDSLPAIYRITSEQLQAIGFGSGEAAVLVRERQRSLDVELEDWRFIGCFAVHFLGRGNAHKLLQEYKLEQLGELSAEDIMKVAGFGEITSPSIANDLHSAWALIQEMLGFGFNIQATPLVSENAPVESPVAGKSIVFTGKMEMGKRDDMKKIAQSLGANVQSKVNAKSNWLVYGANVGSSKINAAMKLGVEIITEEEYLERLAA